MRNLKLTELLALTDVLEILAKVLPTRCVTNPLNIHIYSQNIDNDVINRN
jgi:hypothetical protein